MGSSRSNGQDDVASGENKSWTRLRGIPTFNGKTGGGGFCKSYEAGVAGDQRTAESGVREVGHRRQGEV